MPKSRKPVLFINACAPSITLEWPLYGYWLQTRRSQTICIAMLSGLRTAYLHTGTRTLLTYVHFIIVSIIFARPEASLRGCRSNNTGCHSDPTSPHVRDISGTSDPVMRKALRLPPITGAYSP